MSLFGKTAKELVYDLIVSQNPGLTGKGVTIDKLSFGNPAHITAADPDPEQYTRLNTNLDVSGIIEKGTFGKMGLTYRRLDVAHLFENVVLSVDGTGVSTAADLVPLLRTKYNWLIDATEIYATESMTSPRNTICVSMESRWRGQVRLRFI